MNKETMKQGMIKVLNMYEIPWGNSAIEKIINTWADNKAPLIELLRHHPNWNDEKCYVANEDSDTVIVFDFDQTTGQLIPTLQIIETGSPVCITFR